MYVCVCVHVSVRCGAALERECCALSVCTSLFRTGNEECMITKESLPPRHALYILQGGRSGWMETTYLWPCESAKREIHTAAMQTCGLNEHARHALCSAMRHYACSALCSRVHVSVRSGAALERVCCTLSVCTFFFQRKKGDALCILTEKSLTPFPTGSNHAHSRPFLPTNQE